MGERRICRSRSATKILLLCLTLAIVRIGGHDHARVFPSYDDYDYTVFNPETLYGSPYGGFGRASSSRLARLPLHLTDSSGFDFMEDANEKEDIGGGGDDAEEYCDDDDFDNDDYQCIRAPVDVPIPSRNAPHFNIRDADGRLFACRVYLEEELMPSSVSSSVFDVAEEFVPDPADAVAKSQPKSHPAVTQKVDEKDIRWMDVFEKRIMDELNFECVQFHNGWWSYEWCDQTNVTQFHLERAVKTNSKQSKHSQQQTAPEKETSYDESQFETVPVKSQVHLIGTFNNERGTFGVTYINNPFKPPSLIVTQQFSDGDYCDEAKVKRKIDINMRCCTASDLKFVETMRKTNPMIGHRKYPDTKVHFLGISESKTCSYVGIACSPALCESNMVAQRKIMAKNMTLADLGDENDSLVETKSIREILRRAVGKRCLSLNAGWWSYEFCHLRRVRQFHPVTLFDPKTQRTSIEVEAEHILGVYDAEVHEKYPDEKEIDHLEYPADNGLESTATEDDDSSQLGNGAVFSQTYTGGDVCDHADVTDAAIVQGSSDVSEIARSTTVRFSCGVRYELISVEEDSTCHYVFDVTVPDLCRHPSFVAETVQGQVVKCLPVSSSASS